MPVNATQSRLQQQVDDFLAIYEKVKGLPKEIESTISQLKTIIDEVDDKKAHKKLLSVLKDIEKTLLPAITAMTEEMATALHIAPTEAEIAEAGTPADKQVEPKAPE